jgi:6-pyruvoyltetrahydropterin/6-carboxytetrahydropterin synthase
VYFVTRKAHFNAAHRLHNPEYSDEWNRKVYGPCNHPNWHGHNYKLEVIVAGNPDPETGFLIDLGRLQTLIDKHIIDVCDHRNLNIDVPFLEGVIPTTENLARAFFRELEKPVSQHASRGGFLYAVRVYETDRNSAEYRADAS